MQSNPMETLSRAGNSILRQEDPELFALLEQETRRQSDVLMMVASSSIADPSVLYCQGMPASNVSTEGYPGARYHAGCQVVDEIERLAVDRAKAVFGAAYANVQPHSGTSANQIIMFSLLQPGDTILSQDLKAGGHLSHGASASASGTVFNAVQYELDQNGMLDYAQIGRLAESHRPKLIICGASAYPRTIDFGRFRQIADSVGAFLLADISHIAGLVAAGEHPSSIDQAHFTTTSTYKQLFGPRGGLILIGRDHDTLAPNGRQTLSQLAQRAVFPRFQGTPNLSGVAAKARALAMVMSPDFKALAQRIRRNARVLADRLAAAGYPVVTGGSDNHMVLFDVSAQGISGYAAEKALERCGIVVNKNSIPGDTRPPLVTSGVRLGTNSLSHRGMDEPVMAACADLICQTLAAIDAEDDRTFHLDAAVEAHVRHEVAALCARFPIPRYGSLPAV